MDEHTIRVADGDHKVDFPASSEVPPLAPFVPHATAAALDEIFGSVPAHEEGVQGAARLYLAARKNADDAESRLNDAKCALAAAEAALLDRMQEAGLSAMKLDDEGRRTTVSSASTRYYSAPSGSLEDTEFFMWLLRSGGHDLVKRNIHHATFSSFCRELTEQGKVLHKLVNSVEKKSVRVRKD